MEIYIYLGSTTNGFHHWGVVREEDNITYIMETYQILFGENNERF